MLTSIVVASALNPEAVVRVQACIAQNTPQPHEVIVVDTSPEARGCVRSYNQGLDQAQGDILVAMNDDCQPQSGWLPPILDAILLRDVSLCSPTWQWARLGGHCLCFPREVLESTGGFDERYRHWCADHHMELEVHDSGGLICQVPGSDVIHDPGDPLRVHWRKSAFIGNHADLPNTGQWYLEDQAMFESIWGARTPMDIWPADWTVPV